MLLKQFIVFISIVTSFTFALTSNPTVLGYEKGAICGPISQRKGKGYIKVDGSKLPQDFKLPTLIFHYTDLLNFTNLPNVEKYFDDYAKHEISDSLFDENNSKFNLKVASDFKIDDAKLYNGYTDANKNVEYIVYDTGIYCVYIGKLEDKKIHVPVVFKNSYGNLTYIEYTVYSQMKYVIVLATGLFIYLLNYILKFKVGRDFKDLDSVSVISKAVIFLVLLPFILVNSYIWIGAFLENNFFDSSKDAMLMNLAKQGAQFLSIAFNTYTICILLLFSMGYGVIYYHNGNSHRYRLFPHQTFVRIVGFFVTNLVVIYIYLLLLNGAKSDTPFLTGFEQLEPPSSGSAILNFFAGLTGLFSITWFILIVYFYFRTKKTISLFPPDPNDEDSTQRVVLAFKRSIFIILVLPIIVMFIAGFIIASKVVSGITDSLPDFPSGDTANYDSVIQILALEKSMQVAVLPMLLSNWIYFFAAVIGLFFIWIKDNNGLIIDRNVDDPIENADVSQFNISDED